MLAREYRPCPWPRPLRGQGRSHTPLAERCVSLRSTAPNPTYRQFVSHKEPLLQDADGSGESHQAQDHYQEILLAFVSSCDTPVPASRCPRFQSIPIAPWRHQVCSAEPESNSASRTSHFRVAPSPGQGAGGPAWLAVRPSEERHEASVDSVSRTRRRFPTGLSHRGRGSREDGCRWSW